ncbi:hypothetical protein [Burkholderia sp. Ac-20353]|uniref:hypothetical protein n=1 Tax=Burkholderia sp. Ac-20353 TaxID=2703894 RepID=UPI00197B8FA4|nr:hypothetical protein [Burkholderia sp. Ac-20353]MBN3785685.1 hypothetical protein [Burkholderia sp. Ac-20353]
MKLVIDDVTSPLLFARLSAISSPRDRAAVLRLLAEAACRGDTVGAAPHSRSVPAFEPPSGREPDLPEMTATGRERRSNPPLAPTFDLPSTDTAMADCDLAGMVADGFAAFL